MTNYATVDELLGKTLSSIDAEIRNLQKLYSPPRKDIGTKCITIRIAVKVFMWMTLTVIYPIS